MREYTAAEADRDRAANHRASVELNEDELPPRLSEALASLTAQLRPLLPERYRHLVSPEHLVAAQPNLHNGKRFLRPHLDEPLHDGFGVVIVTVAIRGDATILSTPTGQPLQPYRPKSPRRRAAHCSLSTRHAAGPRCHAARHASGPRCHADWYPQGRACAALLLLAGLLSPRSPCSRLSPSHSPRAPLRGGRGGAL